MSDQEISEESVDQRKDELLIALEDLILNEGFARVTVSHMAAKLRCSRRTLYELAPSKKQLVLLVIGRLFENVRVAGRQAILEIDDPADQLFEYLQVGINTAKRLSPMLVYDIDKWPPSRNIWQEHMSLRVEGMKEIVQRGIAQGKFRGVHAHLVAEIMFASIARIREPDFYKNTEMTLSDAFTELYGIILHALQYRGEEKEPDKILASRA